MMAKSARFVCFNRFAQIALFKLNARLVLSVLFVLFAMIVLVTMTTRSAAAGTLTDCYDIPGVQKPTPASQKVLYVFIDQTMDLTPRMKESIIDLVSQWGSNGENVKISRFSANIQGQYSELVFDESGNAKPSEAYLFHLRYKHKKQILDCLDKTKNEFKDKLSTTLINTLKLTDDKLPKTNLLHSLRDFAEQMVHDEDRKDKTVLIVSDGLENSDVFSFHKHGVIRHIDSRKMLNIARVKKLIPNWHKAKVYFMGIGYISDPKFYVRPKIVEPIKNFWSSYFSEGNAVLHKNSLGTPMLLTKSLIE